MILIQSQSDSFLWNCQTIGEIQIQKAPKVPIVEKFWRYAIGGCIRLAMNARRNAHSEVLHYAQSALTSSFKTKEAG